ncbi:hypothetical protein Dret_1896 [Desulfohalobium retbaense DSM 5692]|uniref:Uncharacterized protein n=1 Tax=Desulfohalobium retbaense (strain ATCC 49708 / DSM 5692 / JCM 16813 / HR100) TaxID=485915 RepID=C8X4F7_DESRD|nr:hypothetical protein Dret_1896 [Desulfohalobium retbaense DSM 5692]
MIEGLKNWGIEEGDRDSDGVCDWKYRETLRHSNRNRYRDRYRNRFLKSLSASAALEPTYVLLSL